MEMKKVVAFKIILVLTLTIAATGCKKSSSLNNSSRATGWQINSRDGGFQYNTSFKEQEASPGLVFVEGGTFTKGRVQDDVMHDWNNTPTQQHVQSFYMDETEVTNMMYLEYLDYTKRVFPPTQENFRAIYSSALPDTLVWRNRLGFNETMTENYLRHPAYGEYPVVGVSWIQAVEFANWRTERVNELNLEKEGYVKRNARINDVNAESNFNTETYINSPTSTYGGNPEIIDTGGNRQRMASVDADGNRSNIYATRQSGVLVPKYRLPTETEWEYAALGLNDVREYNLYRGRKKYPWDGTTTRNNSRKHRGDQLANFKQGKGDYGGIAGWSDDGADITNAVKSYAPNDFGLYDMAGNVAEWVADVYRPIIDDDYNDFNYYRGNVYTKNAINNDGTVKVVTPNDMVFDTLSNGQLVARNLPGQILQVPIDENETYLRTNFDRSNQINFRDGDRQSSRNFYNLRNENPSGNNSLTSNMYNAPRHLVNRDSLGNIVREYDTSNSRSSLISDEVRVYKGGSWKDREYWLDPAQRRYFPQEMATDYIGFRCAMSRVGSKTKDKNKRRN